MPHTPEPWSVGETHYQNVHNNLQPMFQTDIHSGCRANRGNVLAVVYTGNDTGRDSIEANAHRIVAAVNACQHIPTEALEAGIVSELIEVCEEALEESVDASTYPDGPCLPRATRVKMRALIAKARGQS